MRILVGLSGGVDSAVTALLLKQAGHDVSAGFMINYTDEENASCPTREDLAVARLVADFLEIPLYTFDFRKEYEKRIVDYIYREYELGRTPNPDVFCNNLIKFDLFLREAIEGGFDRMATGHYAGILAHDGEYSLVKAKDPEKDQSYFLARLSAGQLAKSIFPLSHMTKGEVRAIARQYHLPNAERKDSQGLCFIGKVSMRDFLEKRIPKHGGDIIDTSGKVIGKHNGLFAYTIGQRKGIEIGGGPPLFVIAKDIKKNVLIVGEGKDQALYQRSLIAREWIGETLTHSRACVAKIRYRQEDQSCILIPETDGDIKVVFDQPQRAITSGQIIVAYEGDRVIGSGVIEGLTLP